MDSGAIDSRISRFAAALANAGRVSTLDGPGRQRFVEEFRSLAVGFLRDAPSILHDRFRSMPLDAVVLELETMQSALYDVLARLLPEARLPVAFSVPIGAPAASPLALEARLKLQGRRLTNELVGVRTDSLALAMLDDLLRRPRRFPFWACQVCRVVVAQPSRGRLVRFCSARCRGQGIPSAARRSQYMREYRRRRRDADLKRARKAIRHSPKDRRFKVLQNAMPGKSRKELLYILSRIRPKRLK